jgi:hypothetical protein
VWPGPGHWHVSWSPNGVCHSGCQWHGQLRAGRAPPDPLRLAGKAGSGNATQCQWQFYKLPAKHFQYFCTGRHCGVPLFRKQQPTDRRTLSAQSVTGPGSLAASCLEPAGCKCPGLLFPVSRTGSQRLSKPVFPVEPLTRTPASDSEQTPNPAGIGGGGMMMQEVSRKVNTVHTEL